jgi:hypothetical protein
VEIDLSVVPARLVPVKLGFIILSLIGVLRIPEEFYLYKDKERKYQYLKYTNKNHSGTDR